MGRKIMLIIGGVFAPVGVILLVICVVTAVGSVQFRADSETATGTVVGVEPHRSCHRDSDHRMSCGTSYFPVVRYRTADGRQVTFSASSGSSHRPQVGDQVTVLYDKGDPDHARVDSFAEFWLAPLITGLLGLVFAAVGLILLGLVLRRRRLDHWLDSNGRRIDAELQGAHPNPNVRINNVHPWRLHAGWFDPSSGRSYTFTSEDLRFDPRDQLAGQRTVQVLIDPADPGRRYRMLLESVGLGRTS